MISEFIRRRSSTWRSERIPIVTLSKSISSAALGACAGGCFVPGRAGAVGTDIMLLCRVTRTPAVPRAHAATRRPEWPSRPAWRVADSHRVQLTVTGCRAGGGATRRQRPGGTSQGGGEAVSPLRYPVSIGVQRAPLSATFLPPGQGRTLNEHQPRKVARRPAAGQRRTGLEPGRATQHLWPVALSFRQRIFAWLVAIAVVPAAIAVAASLMGDRFAVPVGGVEAWEDAAASFREIRGRVNPDSLSPGGRLALQRHA